MRLSRSKAYFESASTRCGRETESPVEIHC